LRKAFTTTIEEDVQKTFKEACKNNTIKMNDVLEILMNAYSNGEITIAKQRSYNYEVVKTKK